VQNGLESYSTGDYDPPRSKFEAAKWGPRTRKIARQLEKEDYTTWNSIFTRLARTAQEAEKRGRKKRGAKAAVRDDENESESDIEMHPSNVSAEGH
jgi:hypothetical protein